MRKTVLTALAVCIVASSLTTGCSKLQPYMNKMAFWRKGNTADMYGNDAAFRGREGRPEAALRTIYFEYDSAGVLSQAIPVLDGNAAWIAANKANVQLEGNCDARGTADYNYALGMKRAESVRQEIVNRGINPASLRAISYGADKPQVDGSSEEAYSRNRRVDFLVFDK